MKKKEWEEYYNSIKDQIPDDAELTINVYYGDETGHVHNSTKLSTETEYNIYSSE